MKTYFKNASSRVYLMLDTEAQSATTTLSNDSHKMINRTVDALAYNNFTADSTDETKWIPISQTVFEAVIAELTSLL